MRDVTAPRPLRADAARNRLLIIDAARELFAERGIEVTLDDVARRAGVGVGTVYRRFANKEELIDGVFQRHFEKIAEQADHALTLDDPWEALVGFFDFACGSMSANQGLVDVMNGLDDGCEQVACHRSRIEPAVEELFRRAQVAGVLRADAVPSDFFSLLFMVGAISEFVQPVVPGSWRRYLALLLDGLRADAGGRLPLPEPALTMSEVHEAKKASVRSRRRH
ncbi:DNA-binding transcriptional regulator, AcrR family [Rhodococcus triatomae]|uniref:DNA-binding transcriptional regulator, AcrR family n=1 Tax=Rhodococcus triatomae TaxID=300028 RepID=A0A1G8NJE9_9NOCA|nr:DNA-binding transcriptional regulator, AcrR family [Rhodococcus triatomae]